MLWLSPVLQNECTYDQAISFDNIYIAYMLLLYLHCATITMWHTLLLHTIDVYTFAISNHGNDPARYTFSPPYNMIHGHCVSVVNCRLILAPSKPTCGSRFLDIMLAAQVANHHQVCRYIPLSTLQRAAYAATLNRLSGEQGTGQGLQCSKQHVC